MQNIKVLIIEMNLEERNAITGILSQVDYIQIIGLPDDNEAINHFINESSPNVVLLGQIDESIRHELAQQIIKKLPTTSIIMIEDELEEDTMYKAIFAGAKDVIIRPFTAAKLLDSVYRASQFVNHTVVPSTEKDSDTEQRKEPGKVITLFSTKGGVGKTFLSVNLAVEIKRLSNLNVCLIDLDLDFGNTSLALDIIPRFTIADIVDDIRNLDQDLIETYLISHQSGIKLLPANAKPMINEFINADQVEIILRTLREAFDYVIVDMPARFYEPVNPAFKIADVLLMITTPEISTIRNVKSSIEKLENLNFPKTKIKVILNKADNSGYIRPKDVESTIGQKMFAIVGADYKLAMVSLNDGNPIVISKPKSSVSKSIGELAKKVIENLKTD